MGLPARSGLGHLSKLACKRGWEWSGDWCTKDEKRDKWRRRDMATDITNLIPPIESSAFEHLLHGSVVRHVLRTKIAITRCVHQALPDTLHQYFEYDRQMQCYVATDLTTKGKSEPF